MSARDAPSGYASSSNRTISLFCFFIRIACWLLDDVALVLATVGDRIDCTVTVPPSTLLFGLNPLQHDQWSGNLPERSGIQATSGSAASNARIHPTLAPCSAARLRGVEPRLSFSVKIGWLCWSLSPLSNPSVVGDASIRARTIHEGAAEPRQNAKGYAGAGLFVDILLGECGCDS